MRRSLHSGNRVFVLGLAIFALAFIASTSESGEVRRGVALGRRAAGGRGSSRVRDAGPATMRDRPRQWDKVDERSDESFPASDPPATY